MRVFRLTLLSTFAVLLLLDAPAKGGPIIFGFSVDTYASVLDPIKIAFDPASSDLFVGRDATGSGGLSSDVVRIHRISNGGFPVVEFGDSGISDPDAVLVDSTGGFSGVAGSVLVAGRFAGASTNTGQIVAIRPDGTVTQLLTSTLFTNAADIAFDSIGRLLLVDNDGDKLLAINGTSVEVLFSLPPDALAVEVASDGRIYTGAGDGTIRIHNNDGSLIDGSFITGLTKARPFTFGLGGSFGNDLYLVDNGNLIRFDSSGTPTVLGSGLGDIRDIEFSPDGSALFLSDFQNDRILRITPVPEPSSIALFAIGAIGMFGYGWRRKRVA